MARWELRRDGHDTEVFDSPAELGSALGKLVPGPEVVQARLACIDEDGREREPTALEHAAIAAAVEREGHIEVRPGERKSE